MFNSISISSGGCCSAWELPGRASGGAALGRGARWLARSHDQPLPQLHISCKHCCGSQHLPLVCAPLLIQHQPLLPTPRAVSSLTHGLCIPLLLTRGIFHLSLSLISTSTPLPFIARMQCLCAFQERQGCRGRFQDGNRTGQELLTKK